ncbi:hypothetical protein FACS1894164_15740 [Spirochaetia bacterium]|nr:hypothetical protein FACS1894164_15740 [Spirochaetia bacterium]
MAFFLPQIFWVRRGVRAAQFVANGIMINDIAANGELNFTVNRLILGDNLEILKSIQDETVDLIYLDSPLFSNRNYEIIWGNEGEICSFQDRWVGGVDHYIRWLFERVEQMYRVLKPTGSIYLHCDWYADAYIRGYVLDKIFGGNNFRNYIIWYYKNANRGKYNFAFSYDTIFWYSESKTYCFNRNKILAL